MKTKAIHRILFPVDFSEHCEAVSTEVLALARRWKSEVILLHVLGLGQGTDYEKEALEKMGRFPVEGLPVRTMLRRGSAAGEILELAKTEEVDVIAMPTRGLGAVASLLFGSVTEQILHAADCPVWTEGRNGEAIARYETVLCAVDLGPNSENVVAWALAVARASEARLRVIHIGHGMQALVELKHLCDRLGVEEQAVLPGIADEGILEDAERIGADLLVIGRGEERQLLGRFRNHAQTLIRGARCAVLSV
jgi:nucleotide-binding universal stress UspA family protein